MMDWKKNTFCELTKIVFQQTNAISEYTPLKMYFLNILENDPNRAMSLKEMSVEHFQQQPSRRKDPMADQMLVDLVSNYLTEDPKKLFEEMQLVSQQAAN